MTDFKICIIGAGSVGFTKKLCADILKVPAFESIEIALTDINMVEGIDLPDACAATCSASINVQRMSVKAAMTGDVDLLKQAMLHDPLVGAICTPEEVWQMVDEMLVAQADWLPQYADAISEARERLKTPKVKTRDWSGAARRDVRSVEQLRREKRTLGMKHQDEEEGHGLDTEMMG